VLTLRRGHRRQGCSPRYVQPLENDTGTALESPPLLLTWMNDGEFAVTELLGVWTLSDVLEPVPNC